VGGIPVQARYDYPVELGEIGDAAVILRWHDNEADMTGLFDFFHQPSNVRPGVRIGHPDFMGTLFAEGVPIQDATNELTWDTSGLAAGSYYVYEITRDPPLAPVFSATAVPVTVQHPGDPRWPAVVVDEPDGLGDTQTSRFAVKWRATGEGTLTATIRYGEYEGDPLFDVATQVPMMEVEDGLYQGCYLWNISTLPQSIYYFQVEVADEAGRTHRSFSRNVLVVFRDADAPDSGPEPSCEEQQPVDGGAGRDGGSTGNGDGGGCPCHVGGRGRIPAASVVSFVLWLAALRRRRRGR
jgi:hypothetical protein